MQKANIPRCKEHLFLIHLPLSIIKMKLLKLGSFFVLGVPPSPVFNESLEVSSPRTGMVASVSSEPQALPVSLLHPSTEFPSSRSAHCRAAAGALAITSTLHTRRRKRGKMTCQLKSALSKQPTWKSHATTLLMAQPK